MGKNSLDARSYRKFLASQTKKSKESGDTMLKKRGHHFQGNGSITRTTTSEEVLPGVTGNSLSCSKRQRADSDSKRHGFFGSNELGHDLPDAHLPNVVSDKVSAARGCLNGVTEVGSLSSPILEREHNGSESPSHIMVITEEHANEACSEEYNSEAGTDGEHNVCSICMLGGELWCCDGTGCGKRYHLSCLDPPFTSALGLWHCSWCVTKKIQFGVHSVSEVVESIWDVKEVATDNEAVVMDKQYLVKYRGLAHVHNRWIPETQLLFEAPKLLSEFNPKNQAVRWKEWTVPQRLLQKRRILSKKQFDGYCHEYDGDRSDCHYEWLVKWTDLGYDLATWELENAPFLTSPEAAKLIKDYESRHEKPEIPPNLLEVDEERKGNFSEFSELSFGCSPEIYKQYLSYVKKLYEHWHKGCNAIIFDDQSNKERALKLILFISSLHLVVQKPFLIISTSSALSVWEAEFLRVVPSANIVVYSGNRAVRKSIRQLEFQNEGGRIMFQVLLSSWDVVVEDLEDLEYISWEAVIIEQCQHSKILRQLNKFKMLAADKKILLDSDQIKYRSADYLKMLLFLDHEREGQDCNVEEISLNIKIDKLKERLAPYVAYECQSGHTRFVEYWVPVRLSNLQLEQYCAKLLSNSMLLSSCLKNNSADALRELVTSSRKCCDHPNLLDQSLPSKRNLETDIQASGKLQLLDKILLEIKSRGLRVVILFQLIEDSRPFSVGDILEDFVHQRFGDCCVRIEHAVHSKKCIKKKEAVDTFNDKESGKFILLIESRACRPNIELSSVDTIILFCSDWDPLNDLRALNKITIGSQFKQLNVFRLYSCCTIEEKVLILAKQGLMLDSGLKAMNRNTCHTLLRWGASYLFSKLDDFHRCHTSSSSSNIFSDQLFLDDVMQELSVHLSCSSENSDASNNSIITKVQQSGGVYGGNMTLLGEKEAQGDGPPTSFWTNLLLGRCPHWIFLSESSPRIRKNVNESTPEYDYSTEKSRKVVSNTVYPIHLISGLYKRKKRTAANKDGKLKNMNQVSVCKRRVINKAFYPRHLKPGWYSSKKQEVVNKRENDSLPIPHVVHCARVPEVNMVESETITIQIVFDEEIGGKEGSTAKDARAASSEQHLEGPLDQSAVKNIQINQSVPSEGHLNPLDEVVIIDDPVEASAHDRLSHEESKNDPVENSPICESTGTSLLLLQPNTSTSLGHSLSVNQLGSQNEQNGGRHGSSSEAQSPREPSLENHLHHFSPLMIHSQQPSADPLLMEMERIRKDQVQALKIHEDRILQLKLERDKERKEVEKKYNLLFRDAEEEVTRNKKYLEMNHHKVYLQKLLAEALKKKHDDNDTGGSPESLIELHAQSGLQHRPASSSTAPPVQRVNHASELFSTSGRPNFSPVNFQGTFQNRVRHVALRAPAPHLQSYSRPPSFVAMNHLPVLGNGERNLQSPQNFPKHQ
ncbi:CHD3-type chromatin-remodeling factor PICKLE-like isoform X1 [Tripterygium wilfordii]|uniref:CHD3-type chromatin-remodeling factor PICKLE-like isoform X1 n=2 Tax=Tripterygium wilfordii TaxID=458696 RepID=UPI0018F840E5|nr:CHD3-type chromatin-remodeling factor PICKLE-like isoform X1 [Tripterygium wilfordii]